MATMFVDLMEHPLEFSHCGSVDVDAGAVYGHAMLFEKLSDSRDVIIRLCVTSQIPLMKRAIVCLANFELGHGVFLPGMGAQPTSNAPLRRRILRWCS